MRGEFSKLLKLRKLSSETIGSAIGVQDCKGRSHLLTKAGRRDKREDMTGM